MGTLETPETHPFHPLEVGVPWTQVHLLRAVPGSPEHRVLLVSYLLTPLGARPRRPLHPGGRSQSLFHGSFKRKTRRMLPFHLLNDLIPKRLVTTGSAWPDSWVIFNLYSDETTQTPSSSVFGPNRSHTARPKGTSGQRSRGWKGRGAECV